MASDPFTSPPHTADHRIAATPLSDAPRCYLGESPRWHEDSWWWVDVPNGEIFRAVPGNGTFVITSWLKIGERVSLVQPAGPDRLLIARGSRLEIRRISRPQAVARTIAHLTLAAGWMLNDGILDADGAVWIGVVATESHREEGWLARVTPDGAVHRAVGSVLMSNGLALTDDGKVLYHSDSARRVVWRHQLHGATVVRSDPFLRIDERDGLPDGLCLDSQGRLWVALYGSGEVRCHSASGERVATITVPVPQTTAVWIGGSDGKDVVITSAREGYTEPERRAQPLAGTTFYARLPR